MSDQLAAHTEVCEAPGQRPATSGPRTVRPDRHRTSSPRQPPSRPTTDLPPPGRRPPGPGPPGRPGPQLLGLEPRRRRRAPNGRAGAGRADSRARCPRHGGGWELARPLPPRPRTLTPPTRSHTIPEASGARAFCRSGAASRPGPEMAAEQRESGLGRAPVRLAGGRSPARKSSAAVALATATGLGRPRPGACGPASGGAGQRFPGLGSPGSRLRPRARPRTPSRRLQHPHPSLGLSCCRGGAAAGPWEWLDAGALPGGDEPRPATPQVSRCSPRLTAWRHCLSRRRTVAASLEHGRWVWADRSLPS